MKDRLPYSPSLPAFLLVIVIDDDALSSVGYLVFVTYLSCSADRCIVFCCMSCFQDISFLLSRL